MNPLMLLSYELRDDPNVEHERAVDSLQEAKLLLAPLADLIVWADLTDADGCVIADTGDLI